MAIEGRPGCLAAGNAVWWLLKSAANYDRSQYSWIQWGSRLYGDVPLGAAYMRY
jgi:hypothetical protein